MCQLCLREWIGSASEVSCRVRCYHTSIYEAVLSARLASSAPLSRSSSFSPGWTTETLSSYSYSTCCRRLTSLRPARAQTALGARTVARAMAVQRLRIHREHKLRCMIRADSQQYLLHIVRPAIGPSGQAASSGSSLMLVVPPLHSIRSSTTAPSSSLLYCTDGG